MEDVYSWENVIISNKACDFIFKFLTPYTFHPKPGHPKPGQIDKRACVLPPLTPGSKDMKIINSFLTL